MLLSCPAGSRPGALLASTLLATGVLGGCGDIPDTVYEIDEAVLWISEATSPPGDASTAAGNRVRLPDLWPLARRRVGTRGWYRADLELDRVPQSPWLVLLPRLFPNGEVWINGHNLGANGRMDDPPSRNTGRPLLLTAPASLWRTGRNQIAVRFVTTPGVPGSLYPFYVGPAEDLGDLRAQVEHLATAGQVSVGLALLLGLVALRQARTGRPEDAAYGWFGGSLLCFFVTGFSTLFPDAELPSRAVEWMVGSAMQWGALMFALGTSRAGSLSSRLGERVWLALFAAATLLYALAPPLLAFPLWVVWAFASFVMLLRTVLILIRQAAIRRSSGWIFAGATILVFVGALVAQGSLAVAGTAILGLSAVVLIVPLIAVGGFLVQRMHHSLRAAEEMSRTLELRVRDREAQLEENHAHIAALQREQVVTSERERLARDMHDGTGGLLVSALSMVRRGDTDPTVLTRTLEDALDDLRLTFGSLRPGRTDLPTMLGLLRPRLQRQAATADLRLDWQVSDAGGDVCLAPEAFLNLVRIVQEAVTNAARHSGGSRIGIRTAGLADGRLAVEITDNGHGPLPTDSPGLGLESMRLRASQLGGELTIASDGSGTRVRLVLPTAGASAGDAAR